MWAVGRAGARPNTPRRVPTRARGLTVIMVTRVTTMVTVPVPVELLSLAV